MMLTGIETLPLRMQQPLRAMRMKVADLAVEEPPEGRLGQLCRACLAMPSNALAQKRYCAEGRGIAVFTFGLKGGL
jgi:O-acetylhomoserine/O-acetylserine sulfhydrylase-like pyridoxal-dependent enzyme